MSDLSLQILKFVGCLIASFIAGWAGAILADATMLKAIAQGLIPACAYVLGNQQMPVQSKNGAKP